MPRSITERTFLSAKIIFNFGQCSIPCIVRRLSADGATLELETSLGAPDQFQLRLERQEILTCRVIWRSERLVGVAFGAAATIEDRHGDGRERGSAALMRSQMLALRAALDHVPLGIVLLDAQLRAQLINRAFRQMWRLPDEVANSNPSIVTLLYHGRDTGAYEVPGDELDVLIAERVRLIQSGESTPIDLRRSSGDVVRAQCTPLPDGGRMLTYTPVTDIVRQSDELRLVRDALENVEDGVLLLDSDLNATFMNRKVRQFWDVSEDEATNRPSFASLLRRPQRTSAEDMAGGKFLSKRIDEVKAGNHVRDLQTPDGRRIRAHCTKLGNGGRMLTYVDITDLTHKAKMLERLATTDPLTGLYNRRHFLNCLEAEWSRFQRYYRCVSVLMLDIDNFKSINDRYGHAVGDQAINAVAAACLEGKRKSDIVGRVGGEEFAILLPETSVSRARIVAERIRKRVMSLRLAAARANFGLTVSIGIAEAVVSMSGIDALMSAADHSLYQAKAEGRNRCKAWSPPPAERNAAE